MTNESQHHYLRAVCLTVCLKQYGDHCAAVTFLKCGHHRHLSQEGRIHRIKGYRLDDPGWGREFHEAGGETVFSRRSLAAIHLLGCWDRTATCNTRRRRAR